MPRVSIVVPVYNVAKFLPDCLNSLINQDERDVEIILIDDGSKDNSLEICKEFAERDSRIIVRHKENGGLSSARNAGLSIAKGDYVSFIDSDDWVDKGIYTDNLKESNCDLYIFGMIHEFPSKQIENSFEHIIDGVYEGKDIQEKVLPLFLIYGKGMCNYICQMSMCRIIFSRNYLLKMKLNFLENLHYGEDSLFGLFALSNAKKMFVNSNIYFHYRNRKNSLVNSYYENYTDDFLYILDELHKLPIAQIIYKSKNPNINYAFLIQIIDNLSRSPNLFNAEKKLSNMLKNKYFENLTNQISGKNIMGKRKIIFYMLKYKLHLPLLLLYKLKNTLS